MSCFQDAEDRSENPDDVQGFDGMETDNDGQAECDAARPKLMGNNEITRAMTKITNALVNTIIGIKHDFPFINIRKVPGFSTSPEGPCECWLVGWLC